MLNNKKLLSVFLIVFIDLLGFSIILPLLPYYAETFGANPTIIGLLTASYAAAQLLGAPVLGRLSDRFGRRPILLVSIGGTIAGFILLGLANSVAILFAARIIDGLTGGNISVAQAYISDVTENKDRARAFGLIGAAFGLGFIIGPALGGVLSKAGYAIPAFVAAGLAVVNWLLVFFWLPESMTPERRAELARAGGGKPPFSISALYAALRRPYVGPLLHTRFFFGLAFSMFQTIFAVYAQTRFNLDAQSTGFILAYVGVLSIITQVFLIGRLTNRFKETTLIFGSVVVMAFSLLGWGLAPSVPMLLLIMIPTSFSGGTLNVVINSASTKAVAPFEIGGILGLSASLESLTRVIAPSLGGLMLDRLGPWAPGIFCSILLVILASYIWRFILPVTPVIYNTPQAPAPVTAQSTNIHE